MAEYINREEALMWFKTYLHTGEDSIPTDTVLGDLRYAIPTADVAPVRRGRWMQTIDNGCEMHQCDQCGSRVLKELYEYENPNRYCYHCGAKMDLGGADN